MITRRLRDNVVRWLVHENYSYTEMEKPENSFHIFVKHAGQFGTPVEIFEPKNQQGVIVVGAKVIMKNNQIARFLRLNETEQKNFENKVADYCNSVKAVNRFFEEEGRRIIGVYVILDDKVEINQQTVMNALGQVSEMHEKTTKFLLKTF